jgi:SAM-dependent methyltransferase
MRVLYGQHYYDRCGAVADLVPAGATVLDVCCGPALIYRRFFKHKPVAYTGLDINRKFIEGLVRRGGQGQVWDLRSNEPLPPADYVLMQSSLYHFLPDAASVVDRMLKAARRQVIVAEPIRNIANEVRWLSIAIGRLTDPGIGTQPRRFTEQVLDAFFAAYRQRIVQSFKIAGGRDKVYVLSAGQ